MLIFCSNFDQTIVFGGEGVGGFFSRQIYKDTAESSQQEVPPEDDVVRKSARVGAESLQPETSSQFKPPTETPPTEAPQTNAETQTLEPEDEEPVLPEIQLKPRRRKQAARKPRQISIPSDSEGFSESEPNVNPIPPPVTESIPPTADLPPPVTEPTPPAADPTPSAAETTTVRRSLLDLPAGDRRQALRIKKLKTKVVPSTPDELRVPPFPGSSLETSSEYSIS